MTHFSSLPFQNLFTRRWKIGDFLTVGNIFVIIWKSERLTILFFCFHRAVEMLFNKHKCIWKTEVNQEIWLHNWVLLSSINLIFWGFPIIDHHSWPSSLHQYLVSLPLCLPCVYSHKGGTLKIGLEECIGAWLIEKWEEDFLVGMDT